MSVSTRQSRGLGPRSRLNKSSLSLFRQNSWALVINFDIRKLQDVTPRKYDEEKNMAIFFE